MLDQILKNYLEIFPEETKDFELLQAQLADNEVLNNRKNFRGHVAGSGLVLSPDKAQVLLIHHRAYNKWMQPGGHWESDEESDPLAAARREIQEETGVDELEYMPIDAEHRLVPLDLETHYIGARSEKNEPEHYHHDFRYVFISPVIDLTPQEAEVHGAKWFALHAPEAEHVAGMIEKLQRQGFIQA